MCHFYHGFAICKQKGALNRPAGKNATNKFFQGVGLGGERTKQTANVF